MLTLTHIVVVILIGLLLRLNSDEWFVAILFGVVIDIDHIFAAPRYISENGWAALFRPTWDDGSGLPWKSLFHEPVGVVVVAPAAIGWRYMAPLLFWLVHLGIDMFEAAILQFSYIAEVAIFASACGGIALLRFQRWKDLGAEGDFRDFLSEVWSDIKMGLNGFGRSIRALLGST